MAGSSWGTALGSERLIVTDSAVLLHNLHLECLGRDEPHLGLLLRKARRCGVHVLQWRALCSVLDILLPAFCAP